MNVLDLHHAIFHYDTNDDIDIRPVFTGQDIHDDPYISSRQIEEAMDRLHVSTTTSGNEKVGYGFYIISSGIDNNRWHEVCEEDYDLMWKIIELEAVHPHSA